jgi:hypothetical protein
LQKQVCFVIIKLEVPVFPVNERRQEKGQIRDILGCRTGACFIPSGRDWKMNKSQDIVIRILITAALLVFGVLSSRTVFAETETYTASTMRLLHYEGSVEIEDASGESGLVMENIRFNSGDSLHTGTDSSASVGLDSTKIVSLDEQTSVKFTKQAKALEMKLTEGTIFLDVQEKLQENETLDIKTSNMTVGIRGTVIYVSTTQESQSEGQTGYTTTTMGVLNGQTEYVYTDQDGKEQKKELSAGRKVVLKKKGFG